jgi:uncharacterized protein YfaS (alpha-2-macroglobulin family)
MGGTSRRFWALSLFIVAINVTGLVLIRHEMLARPLPGLRLMSFSPGQTADDADRIVLRFDEPIMRADQCNAPLEHPPFVIEPAPPAGHWRWAEPDQLVYLLEAKLPAGREYSIRPADDIETKLGRRVIGEAQFTIRTRPLAWLDTRITAHDQEHVTVELAFNQPVRPDDLLRHMKVIEAKSKAAMDAQCLTRTADEKLVIRLPRPRDERFQIAIAPQLTGDGGTIALGTSQPRTLQANEAFKLRNAQVYANGKTAGHDVSLHFTGRIDPKQALSKLFEVSPSAGPLTTYIHKDESIIVVRGNFISGTRYTLTVSPNLLDGDGKPLGTAPSLSVEIPDLPAVLRIPESRGILSPHGNLTLDLKACNIEGLTLSATRLHANNLVPHLRGEDDDATSRQIVERPIKLKSTRNKPIDLAIDLRQLLEKNASGPGVYRIKARADKPYWVHDESVVTISDLGITVKEQRGGYHVFVTSLLTAKPVEGVKLAAITFSNQTIAEAETNAQGIAVLKAPSTHPDGAVWLITAQLGDDLNFLQPDRRRWVLDDVDQTGRAHTETYDAMLYTERGVYRPGDVVHLTMIVRDAQGAIPPAMPLTLRVKRPDGRVVAELPIARDAITAQGTAHIDYASLPDGQLGRYEFAVTLPGSAKSLGAASALIEAFVPIRIEVKSQPTKQRYGPGENPTFDISARYLFGQPAAELPLTLSPSLKSAGFESKRFSGFTFDDGRPAKKLEVETVQESLDKAGKSSTSFALPDGEEKRLWRANVTATVTEPGGRSVSQSSAIIIDEIDRHLGLRLEAGRVVRSKKQTPVNWCLVNGGDEPVRPAKLRMLLERIEHDWTLQAVDGNNVWKSVERPIVVKNEGIGINEARSFMIECPAAGNHRLTVSEEGGGIACRIQFYASDDADESTSPPVTSPERVELVLDKKAYVPGDSAKVIVRSPFEGTLMLSVETDRVMSQFVLEMKANTATVDVPIDASLRGGGFLSATVIRPIDAGSDKWLPHRAMGMARIATDHAAHQAALAVQVPDAAEPGETVTVHIETAPHDSTNSTGPSMAHVWAVDDGILLTTNFKAPGPLDHFFAPRAAAVSTADIFADLLPDHQRPVGTMRIGAGDDEEVAIRRSPVPMKQRQAAVVWRAAQPVGADGRLTVEMKMPRITGRMRVMAVLVDGDRYATGQHDVTLASPLLVEASWPRFAAPGDIFDVPVKLFNATRQPVTAHLAFEIEGPVTIVVNDADRSVVVRPGEPRTIILKAKATGLGAVKATVRAAGSSGDLGREVAGESAAMLAVRPITPLHVESSLVRIKAGEAIDVKTPDSFEPGTTRTTITLSGNPQVELRPAIERLLDYPYGCVEQTTSRLMAILHAPQLLALESTDDARIAFANDAIAAGIARLWSMQTRGGGLAYWPGETSPTTWGTAYASLFLVQAQRAGHNADRRFTDELTKYLAQRLDSRDNAPLDDNQRAMICHVLAAWDHAPHGWIARLSDRVDALDIGGRAHLAAAWHELGRTDRALAVLPAQTLEIGVRTSTITESLTSPTRQHAALLSVLLDIDRTHAWVPLLVRRIEANRDKGYWGTTLDNASALSALAKYQLIQPRDPSFTGRVMVAGAEQLAFDHKAVAQLKVGERDGAVRIETRGKGDAFVTLTTQGLMKADSLVPYERNLKVHRQWLSREGKPVDPKLLKVGDLVRVEMSIAAPLADHESVNNIAIVDALPACMEVENPRLATSAKSDDEGAMPDRVEFLDDRVVLFTSVGRQPRVFHYLLRVTTAGTFALPPAQASCMYDAAVAAMGPRGEVVVSK